MDLKDYKLKNTTVCDCGHNFIINDITKMQRIKDRSFYSGLVKHVSETVCPDCQKETLLLLQQKGQTYIVKDIGQKERTDTAEKDEKAVETEEIEAVKTEVAPVVIKLDEIKDNPPRQELICPDCQKTFKTKSGLASHAKTHKK